MRLLLRLFLLIVLSPLSIFAADYYFAAVGHDLNPCTLDQPCLSLDKLNQLVLQARPGDTFYLRSGDVFDGGQTTCIFAPNIDGAPGRPITLTSYGLGYAILENCSPTAIRGRRSDWWVVERLEIRNSKYGIACNGCQDWLVQHNVMHNLDHVCFELDSFPKANLNGTPAARWVVRHNTCYETGLTGHGEGVYLHPGPVEDLLIEHNEFFNLRDEGVNCKGNNRHIVVRHNYIHDFYPPLAHALPDDGILSRLARGMGQWLLPPATAGQNASEDTAINYPFNSDANVLVERNIIENMPYSGIVFKRLEGAVTQHNLIVGSGFIAIDYTEGATGRIVFNTVYNNRQAHRKTPDMIANDDILWGNSLGNNLTDPQFVSTSTGDFNLAVDSDRRDAGSDGLSQGVLHSPSFRSCTVQHSAPNTVRCAVQPIRFSPLRCPEAEALTVTVNGTPRRPTTRCRVVSDTVVRIQFPGPPVAPNDTVRLSAAYGALQDSAWIGGMTPEGECLASLFACNSRSLAVDSRRVNNRVE